MTDTTMATIRHPQIRNAKRTLSIGETAAVLGVSVNTLRFYEAEGLIIPERTNGNQRRYSPADIDRIMCIREAVGGGSMTIDSIKHIMALIPCWDIIGCSDEDRVNCRAYTTARKPCWTFRHKTTICAHRECRECEVYRLASSCDSIKSAIVRSTQRR
jgi:MerR family transcriptional regulator/heat shock protein HspR